MVLAWTDSTTPGATHAVYRSLGACGAFVQIATNVSATYTDVNVSNGETYAYKIVATEANDSAESATIVRMYGGPADQYSATLTADGLTDRRGAITVFANPDGLPQGCGEFQRLQRLRGRAALCGK